MSITSEGMNRPEVRADCLERGSPPPPVPMAALGNQLSKDPPAKEKRVVRPTTVFGAHE